MWWFEMSRFTPQKRSRDGFRWPDLDSLAPVADDCLTCIQLTPHLNWSVFICTISASSSRMTAPVCHPWCSVTSARSAYGWSPDNRDNLCHKSGDN